MLAKVFLNSHFLHITVFYQNKPSFKNETSSLHWRNNLHYVNQFTFPTLQTNASRRTKIVRILLAAFLLLAPKTPNSCNKSIRNRAEPMLSTLESQSGISVTAQIISMLTWINRRVKWDKASRHLTVPAEREVQTVCKIKIKKLNKYWDFLTTAFLLCLQGLDF